VGTESIILTGIAVGLVAGVFGGLFGIGGGLVIVPALVLFVAIPQKTATGTSLFAQLLPVGVLGVIAFSRRGEVRFDLGLSIAVGLLVGMLVGALLAGQIPAPLMKRLYGIFLVSVGLYFLVAPQGVKERPLVVPAKPTDQVVH
jgi:uncharacterized protein